MEVELTNMGRKKIKVDIPMSTNMLPKLMKMNGKKRKRKVVKPKSKKRTVNAVSAFGLALGGKAKSVKNGGVKENVSTHFLNKMNESINVFDNKERAKLMALGVGGAKPLGPKSVGNMQ